MRIVSGVSLAVKKRLHLILNDGYVRFPMMDYIKFLSFQELKHPCLQMRKPRSSIKRYTSQKFTKLPTRFAYLFLRRV